MWNQRQGKIKWRPYQNIKVILISIYIQCKVLCACYRLVVDIPFKGYLGFLPVMLIYSVRRLDYECGHREASQAAGLGNCGNYELLSKPRMMAGNCQ